MEDDEEGLLPITSTHFQLDSLERKDIWRSGEEAIGQKFRISSENIHGGFNHPNTAGFSNQGSLIGSTVNGASAARHSSVDENDEFDGNSQPKLFY